MPTEPRTEKGRRTKAIIVQAATVIFSRDGYVEAKVQDIVAEAKVALGNFYRYFENKDDVFRETLRRQHWDMLKSTRTDGIQELIWRSSISQANRQYLQLWKDHGGLLVAFRQAESLRQDYRDDGRRTRRAFVNRCMHSLERDRGQVPDDVREGFKHLLHALVLLTEELAYASFAVRDPLVPTELEQVLTIANTVWLRTLEASIQEFWEESTP